MNSKYNINKNDYKPDDAIINANSSFAVVEVYKSIRTNLLFSMPKTEGAKVIVVTSSTAGEGKTTTCINLAQTFAQMNARVLLLDCDLRKPKVHRYLKLDKKDGLSNVFCGLAGLDTALKINVRENLDVLTAGDTPPNPAELLQSKEFAKILTVLKKVYDYIIIDTPPINLVTDATSVIKQSSGTILLIKKGYTTYDMVDEAMDKLKKVNANILGTILIDEKGIESKKYKGYSGYRYGYGYGYGKNHKEESHSQK